jgi:hypothetical protein
MTIENCAVCGKSVAITDQADHLKAHHLGPHYFWFDCREHRTLEPSMTVAALKKMANTNPTYYAYEEREGADIALSDAQAVDLTRRPRFYAIPPATMFG